MFWSYSSDNFHYRYFVTTSSKSQPLITLELSNLSVMLINQTTLNIQLNQ